MILPGRRFTLVDDAVTRGASFLGMISHMQQAFNGYEIMCFGLVRTQSYAPVDHIVAPVEGLITYQNGQLRRNP